MVTLGTEVLIHEVAVLKPVLQQALDEVPDGEDLVLDCNDTSDIDGAGLQMLVVLARTLQRRGGALRLVACSPGLHRRIAAAALDGCFVFDAEAAA